MQLVDDIVTERARVVERMTDALKALGLEETRAGEMAKSVERTRAELESCDTARKLGRMVRKFRKHNAALDEFADFLESDVRRAGG